VLVNSILSCWNLIVPFSDLSCCISPSESHRLFWELVLIGKINHCEKNLCRFYMVLKYHVVQTNFNLPVNSNKSCLIHFNLEKLVESDIILSTFISGILLVRDHQTWQPQNLDGHENAWFTFFFVQWLLIYCWFINNKCMFLL
jgi:hypothetical protein